MIQEIRVPEIGENIESGDVVKLLVAKGDPVDVDQPILELETDKAVVEIPSPISGLVSELLVKEGDTIEVGQVMVKLDTPEPDAKTALAKSSETATDPDPLPTIDKAPVEEKPASAPSQVKAPAAAPSKAKAPAPAATAKPGAKIPVAAAPAVRRLARELGVEVGRVVGSGTGGRISSDDIKNHVKRSMSGAGGTPVRRVDLPDFERWGTVDRQPLSKIGRITAESMTRSWTTIPHVTQHDRADITGLEAFRKKTASQVAAEGGKLTITAIILKVCAAALNAFPQFNSSLDWEAQEIVRKHYINIGIAVDTERGLIVPVVRDVESKSLTQLSIELQDLAGRTRDKKIKPEELEGGNFTISNLGGIGGVGFTPIVYGSQVAILGVSRTQKELQLQDGKPAERLMLPLALSYDHRVINGADGARFLRWVCEALENPYLVLLGA